MLYKFQCKKSADVLMLEDLTSRIFEVIDRPLEIVQAVRGWHCLWQMVSRWRAGFSFFPWKMEQ
ncbi:MAG: hypothetical protein RIR50_1183, partial [Pseudomonadota bacterium]